MRVVHSFGREDQLDRAAVERLAGSLGRLLGQEQAGAAPEQLWRLGIGQVQIGRLCRALAACRYVGKDIGQAEPEKKAPGRQVNNRLSSLPSDP